ncbi:MAG: ribonuclease J [Candidatus Moranbacteria bacterium CG_4_9_14_3_um_filter_40_7]|nr:MAG: ribonuclease J [Candidatus Moranbacteria bacterium CG23_combo_of_CG06-09_8_20_14_all_40_16]PIU80773.1 MAG: ribonuclease J [Candidatus Moranbacteria bacterium CG06_land_8_20_14_3_00_40_12]PJA87885.1 MAG: ribonuclease J [Candidatus Moranbacteria bacterium CG_4_9_14_3_um_filter_40_7]
MIKKMISPLNRPLARSYSRSNLRIIPLGGLEEVGRNMTIFEYGPDIIIVDLGLQFPDEDMPGIDYIIPDISYLKGKEKNIRGVIITHGHYDHIGAIPHIMEKIGNPPIYMTELTRGIVMKRQDDFKDKAALNIHTVKKIDRLRLGIFNIEFFHVNHTIPDAVGLAIGTPVGTIIHTGDFKFDHSPISDAPADIAKIARLGSENVLALMSDSTDSKTPGYSLSESRIAETLDEIFQHTEGRLIIATFAALISRIQSVVAAAEKNGRKVAIDGYSMKTNVEIAKNLGYLKCNKNTLIPINKINEYPDNKVSILCTGAQGESNAVLMRIVNGEHRFVKVHKADTFVLSSSVIPGNERTVQSIMDTIYRKDAKVINYKMMDVHAGGHARQEDLKMMINLIRPKYLIPVHGNYYMLKLHGELGISVGMDPKNILIGENGKVMEFDYRGNGKVTEEKVPTNHIMVDGLGVGDIGQVVLRDRQVLAKDGMFVITTIVDGKTKKIVGKPQVTSRGFIFVKENFDLVNATKKRVEEIIAQKTTPNEPANWDYVKNAIRESIGSFLYMKTQRRPMVLPVIIEV